MSIFDQFDNAVDTKAIAEATKKAAENSVPEIPAGTYTVEFTKIEMTTTKAKPVRPMLTIQAKILDGKYKKFKLFMNRVLQSAKSVEATGNLINGTCTWLSRLGAEDMNGDPIRMDFESYSQFAELIEEVFDAVEDMGLTYEVEYDPEAFNSISVKKILD